MKKIDCFGDFCPVPLLKIRKEVDQIKIGEAIMMVTDHSCVVESIEDYFKDRMVDLFIEEVINGVWEITLTRLD